MSKRKPALSDLLDELRELHANDYDEGRWDWGGDPHDNARDTAGRLLAAIEAVQETIEKYPVPHKRDDPTAEIASAIEGLGDAVLDALADKLTGEDDD